MNFKDYPKQVTRAISVVKLEKDKMKEVHDDKNNLVWGIIILVLPFVLNWVLLSLSMPSGFQGLVAKFVFWPVFLPGLALAGIPVFIWIFAEQVYKTKVDLHGVIRTLLYGSIIYWVTVVPYVLMLIGLDRLSGMVMSICSLLSVWICVIAYTMLMKMYNMKQQPALITAILAGVVYFVILEILGNIFIGDYYSPFMF